MNENAFDDEDNPVHQKSTRVKLPLSLTPKGSGRGSQPPVESNNNSLLDNKQGSSSSSSGEPNLIKNGPQTMKFMYCFQTGFQKCNWRALRSHAAKQTCNFLKGYCAKIEGDKKVKFITKKWIESLILTITCVIVILSTLVRDIWLTLACGGIGLGMMFGVSFYKAWLLKGVRVKYLNRLKGLNFDEMGMSVVSRFGNFESWLIYGFLVLLRPKIELTLRIEAKKKAGKVPAKPGSLNVFVDQGEEEEKMMEGKGRMDKLPDLFERSGEMKVMSKQELGAVGGPRDGEKKGLKRRGSRRAMSVFERRLEKKKTEFMNNGVQI